MKKKISRKYTNNWPIVAICYDFDKTLSPKDMQEFGLIPKLDCSSTDFWDESNGMAKREGMDKILAYMWTIIKRARETARITEKDFNKLGSGIELFPGVDTWFERINNIAAELHINVEHYIISAGLKEIIKGTSIAKYFEEIYASSFLYDVQYKNPIWPRQVVNYTTKTQYLFRINKNCLDLSDEDAVNDYKEDKERRIPFRNFIYIGDSETDIPAMKIVKNGGGVSIGVYNPQTKNMDRVRKLLNQERIDFLMPADYSEGSRIEKLVEATLQKINANNVLISLNNRQKQYVEHLEYAEELIEYTDNFIDRESLDSEDISNMRSQARRLMKRVRRQLHAWDDDIASVEEIDAFADGVESKLMEVFKKKRKEAKERLALSQESSVKTENNDGDSGEII